MDMDMDGHLDLREAFDRGFGPEPPHRPVAERIEAGRRAVRRRRAAGTVLTLAVATAVGLGAVALLGPGPDGSSQVATDPPSASPKPAPSPTTDLAHYDEDGTLVIDPAATVVRRVDNPLGLQPPEQSVALDLRLGEDETWTILTFEVDEDGTFGSMGSFASPSADFAGFADWVQVQAQAQAGPAAPRGDDVIPKVPVRFDQGAHLVPVDGIRIVLQQPRPDLPESFAPAGSRTAVALVEGRDGRRQWVLARDVGGFDVLKFPASRGGEDLDAFLDFARQQYSDSGAGLR